MAHEHGSRHGADAAGDGGDGLHHRLCLAKADVTAESAFLVDMDAHIHDDLTGLQMLCGPGNDMVSTTALTAAGCHVILFSTGRGTPFGAPAPTLKVFTNERLCQHKANWMDFNAGVVATGERTIDEAAEDLWDLVLETASGKQTSAERRGCHEISIWKDGVTL